jgi:hypothetical protein
MHLSTDHWPGLGADLLPKVTNNADRCKISGLRWSASFGFLTSAGCFAQGSFSLSINGPPLAFFRPRIQRQNIIHLHVIPLCNIMLFGYQNSRLPLWGWIVHVLVLRIRWWRSRPWWSVTSLSEKRCRQTWIYTRTRTFLLWDLRVCFWILRGCVFWIFVHPCFSDWPRLKKRVPSEAKK